MRAWSYILILLGIVLLACAGYDELRGSTTKPWTFRRHSYNTAYLYRLHVLKEKNPELFREFMKTHWTYAVSAEVVGVILLLLSTNRDDG